MKTAAILAAIIAALYLGYRLAYRLYCWSIRRKIDYSSEGRDCNQHNKGVVNRAVL
jgi:hypothetical protein